MAHTSSLSFFLRGAAGIVSVPSIVLMTAFVGFAGLALESGITLGQSVFMTAFIWAMPSQLVLVGAMAGGTGVLSATLAVSLASIRFMPMIVAWVPVVRGPTTPKWKLMFFAHFVAITSWVLSLSYLPKLDREARLPYFAGFALTLTATCIIVTAVAYSLAAQLPAMAAGALYLLTPVYFLFSLWNAARTGPELIPLGLGMVLGPLFHLAVPEFGLLMTGLVGGTVAYLIQRRLRQHSPDESATGDVHNAPILPGQAIPSRPPEQGSSPDHRSDPPETR